MSFAAFNQILPPGVPRLIESYNEPSRLGCEELLTALVAIHDDARSQYEGVISELVFWEMDPFQRNHRIANTRYAIKDLDATFNPVIDIVRSKHGEFGPYNVRPLMLKMRLPDIKRYRRMARSVAGSARAFRSLDAHLKWIEDCLSSAPPAEIPADQTVFDVHRAIIDPPPFEN
jgi:hypothetical protein